MYVDCGHQENEAGSMWLTFIGTNSLEHISKLRLILGQPGEVKQVKPGQDI
jgi:hypothetical protein